MESGERFTKTIFGGGARSSLGYRGYFNSRTSIEYVDRVVRVFVDAEGLASQKSIALDPNQMVFGSINGQPLTDEILRAQVLERVQSAAEFLGWKLC